MSTPPFTSARKEKLSTEIIRQIRTAILNGDYNQGDLLPPEKELIIQFGVSKHTIREALRALEGMGLICMKRGASGGPEVRPIDWQTARDGFSGFLHFQEVSIRELSEVRKLIEPHIARKAAEFFDENSFAELVEAHEKCAALIKKGQRSVEAEVSFHVLLAKYSGNKVLWVMLDFVDNVLAEMKKGMRLNPESSLEVQAEHQKIMDAVRAKDPDGAEKAMYEHICNVENRLTKHELRLNSIGAKQPRPETEKTAAPR